VAAHAARALDRRVERLERHVRGPDEIDLVSCRPRRREAERHVPDPARDDVGRVEEVVEPVRPEAAPERWVVDAVHRHEQLVERHLPHAAEHPREGALVDDPGELDVPGGIRRRRGVALLEHPLAPAAGLEDQVAGGAL
jgi:hypothetical protein